MSHKHATIIVGVDQDPARYSRNAASPNRRNVQKKRYNLARSAARPEYVAQTSHMLRAAMLTAPLTTQRLGGSVTMQQVTITTAYGRRRRS